MLAKLGWKMTQGENDLAKDCITSKYVRKYFSIALRKAPDLESYRSCFLSLNLKYDVEIRGCEGY